MKIQGLIATLVFVGGSSLIADQPAPTPAPAPATAPVPAAAPAATPPNANAPKITFATPVYDFGKAKAGDLIKYSFIFTNTGNASLELSGVQPSCGCTTAGEWTRKVEPGQTGSIPIQVATANFNGPIFKSVTVTCNDKTQERVMLQVKGTVWKPVEVNPQFAVLNVTPDAPNASTVVHIVNNGDEPLTLSAPESNNQAFQAEIKEIEPGKKFDVTVKTVGTLTAGNVQGQIAIKTSLKDMPVVNVTAWANVQGPFTLIPAQLTLPSGPLAAKTTLNVTVQNNSTNGITLTNPSINSKNVTVDLQELQPGRTFRANVTFPEGFELPAGQNGELTLQPGPGQILPLRVQITQAPKVATPIVPAPQAQGLPIKAPVAPQTAGKAR